MEGLQRAAPGAHPLDPLSASETSILRAHDGFAALGEHPGGAGLPDWTSAGVFEREPSLDVPPSTQHSDHCGGGSST
jgi:hypothetical protein